MAISGQDRLRPTGRVNLTSFEEPATASRAASRPSRITPFRTRASPSPRSHRHLPPATKPAGWCRFSADSSAQPFPV